MCRKRAIIIGGGISGKLAARVLSDFFQEVIIVEKDQEPKGPFPRKGARQGEHLHALLFAGQNGLEVLFPGITEKFHAGGAVKINSTRDLAWFHHGVWKLRYDGGYSTTLQTRPHLEWHIQQYIQDIPNITFYYDHAIKNYIYNAEENRVMGVEIVAQNQSSVTITADLIVDASGAASFTSHWLKELGKQIPSETVTIGLSYFSQLYQLQERDRDWSIKLVYPNPPHEKIGGTISKVEGDRYIATIFGYENEIDGKEVLKNDNGFVALAKKLSKPDIYNELVAGTPLSQPTTYRVPHITWRRFDKVGQLPKGLLLVGDTVCRIDPVFGQGMSIAVLEAMALQKLFRENVPLQEIIMKFQKQVAKIVSPIWKMVITEDFRYQGVTGRKPVGLGIQQWYAKNIFILSSQDKEIYDAFVNVMNLVKPTTALMRPRIVKKVLK